MPVRNSGARIGRISTGLAPPQAINEELGRLFKVQHCKAEMIDSLGYRHTLRVASNAAVERRRAALSSAPRGHNEMPHMRRARAAV
jgi:hypothetical protein